MINIVFYWMLLTKTITPAGENDGHKMYTIWYKDGKVIDYAYKGEVLNYIKTGTFEYDDFYEWPDDEEPIAEEVFYSNNK